MGGVKVAGGGGGGEKVRCQSVAAVARSRMRPWVLRATTPVLLWAARPPGVAGVPDGAVGGRRRARRHAAPNAGTRRGEGPIAAEK